MVQCRHQRDSDESGDREEHHVWFAAVDAAELVDVDDGWGGFQWKPFEGYTIQ